MFNNVGRRANVVFLWPLSLQKLDFGAAHFV